MRTFIFTIGLFIGYWQQARGQTAGDIRLDSSVVSDTDDLSLQLDSVCAMKPSHYDPSIMVRCTNRLLVLRKDSLLVVVQSAFERNSGNAEGYGLFLALRMVFNLTSNMTYPEMHFGKPDIERSRSKSVANRYPILLVNDIPFLVVQRTFMTGVGESIDKHLSFYKKFGQLRTVPILFKTDLPKKELLERVKTTWANVYPDTVFSRIQAEIEQQIQLLYE
jgi:hypothetical protein